MVTGALTEFLFRRKQRAIAITMSALEKEVFPSLSSASQQKVRKIVLDQFNELHDAAVDLVRSMDNDTVQINEIYLDKINEIHSHLVQNGKG